MLLIIYVHIYMAVTHLQKYKPLRRRKVLMMKRKVCKLQNTERADMDAMPMAVATGCVMCASTGPTTSEADIVGLGGRREPRGDGRLVC